MLTTNEIQGAVKPLLNKYNAEYAMLYGSYARGDADESSDVDLVVFGGERFNRTDIFAFAEDLRGALRKDADVYEISEIEPVSPLYSSILREGVKIEASEPVQTAAASTTVMTKGDRASKIMPTALPQLAEGEEAGIVQSGIGQSATSSTGDDTGGIVQSPIRKFASTPTALDTATLASVERFAAESRKRYDISDVIVFGSYASGTQRADSDIDVALVSSDFTDTFDSMAELMGLTWDIDARIEPHPIRRADYDEATDYFVREIKDTGIKVA